MAASASSSQLFAFVPPPLGKPDRTQPKPEGTDTRRRVVQLGSQNNTCAYTCFNLLRERYNAPNTSDRPERKFERIVSALRKEISAHERTLPDLVNQLNQDTIKRLLTSLTQEAMRSPEGQFLLQLIDSVDKKTQTQVPIRSAIPDFLKQDKHKNLYDYFIDLRVYKRQDMYRRFFDALNVQPKDLFEEARKRDPKIYDSNYCQGKDWESMSGDRKSILLGHLARQLTAEKYHLKISPWRPSQPIESLIAELKARGPLIVNGRFGTTQYSALPQDLKKPIEGRAVYGWTKSAPRNKGAAIGHTIVLVGAEKTATRAFVYYIDPEDDSDPACPGKQRIFCMSYERLTAADTICDDNGFARNNAPDSIGYARYREKGVAKPQLEHEPM